VAVTRFADVTNQVPDIWATDLYAQAEHMTFWHRFEGPPGGTMPIVRRDELENDPGDVIKIDVVLALTGAGQTGDTTLLEGNEEKLVLRQASVTVESLQHAVRWGKKANALNVHNLRTTSLGQLRKWLAGKLDTMIFTEVSGGSGASIAEASLPTSMKFFAGTATSIGTVADSDAAGRLKLNDISDIKALAKTNTKIEPIRVDDGLEVYGLVLHEYAALALKKDTQWQQAQREAQLRGGDNPLFTGALGMWDNVILYTSPRVRTANDGAASITVARNFLFGAQAVAKAYAYYPDWTEQEFSYGQESGVATYTIVGHKLVVFDLNAVETGGDSTDDTAIGGMLLYSSAVAPVA
jgi:N4-gp56 family major capsid protein